MDSFDPLDSAASYGRYDLGSNEYSGADNPARGDAGSASSWQDALRSFGLGGPDQSAQAQDGTSVRKDGGTDATPLLAAAIQPGAGGGEPPDMEWAKSVAKDPKPLVGKTAQDVEGVHRPRVQSHGGAEHPRLGACATCPDREESGQHGGGASR